MPVQTPSFKGTGSSPHLQPPSFQLNTQLEAIISRLGMVTEEFYLLYHPNMISSLWQPGAGLYYTVPNRIQPDKAI